MTFDLPVLAPAPADFAFACNRCGACCSNGTGHVWVGPDEVAPLAAALGETVEAFARRRLRSIDGRLSLVERDGRCALLSGTECSAYGARPRGCRTFPFWDDVLSGGSAFEQARESCPGIQTAPRRSAREAAYADLRALYAATDARVAEHRPRCAVSGLCCDFPAAGHRLYATWLEADYFVEHGPALAAADAAWCEAYHGRRCEARSTRPLGCRTYFCDGDTSEALRALHEETLAELRAVEARHGYPHGYGEWVELVPVRRAALRLLDGRRERAAEVA